MRLGRHMEERHSNSYRKMYHALIDQKVRYSFNMWHWITQTAILTVPSKGRKLNDYD